MHRNSERVGFVYTLLFITKRWRPIPLNRKTKSNDYGHSTRTRCRKGTPSPLGPFSHLQPREDVYLTLGYTSAAGNTYYKAIRLSDRLAVYYHIGEGYAHTFLNGITLFAWNGQKANIIAQKFWGGCNWRCFNERTAKEESIIMLKDFLAGQAKSMGSVIADSHLLAFSRNMIEETQKKLLR